MLDLLRIGIEGEIPRHFPNENLPILGGRGDDAVVERVPVGVEY